MPARKVPGHNIIISGIKFASDEQKLKEQNVKAIMTVCEKDPPHFPGIAQLKVKLSDPKETLAPNNAVWEAVATFALAQKLAKKRGGNVVIHCVNGNNRSALVTALWLMMTDHTSLQEAVKITQVKNNKPWMKALGFIWQ